MGLLDFLFQGQTPPAVTTESNSQGQLPLWYAQYLQSMFNRASSIAGEDYTPYAEQRIAGFTPDQQAAQQGVRDMQGSWSPYLNQSYNFLSGAGTGSAYGVMSPYAQQAMGQNAYAAASPWLQQAGQYNPLASGQGYINQAAGMNPMGQAQSYFGQAGSTIPQVIGNYMSPYTQNVVSEIARQGNQNFSENILPELNSAFVGSGQFGSTRNMEMAARAARDTQANILGAQSQALQQGYGQAGNFANMDLSRMGQLGSQVGQLGLGQMGALGQLGATSGSLAGQTGNLYGQLAGTAGQAMGQYGNLMGQLTGTMGGIYGTDMNRMLQAGQGLGTLGGLQQSYGLRDAAALSGIGQEQQALGQQSLDTAYQDFLTQQGWPAQQASFMSSILRGLQVPASTSTTTTSPYQGYMSPSPLATLAGLFGAGQGIWGSPTTTTTTGRRAGGRIGYRQGGPVRYFAPGGLNQFRQPARQDPRQFRGAIPRTLQRVMPQPQGGPGMPQFPPQGMPQGMPQLPPQANGGLSMFGTGNPAAPPPGGQGAPPGWSSPMEMGGQLPMQMSAQARMQAMAPALRGTPMEVPPGAMQGMMPQLPMQAMGQGLPAQARPPVRRAPGGLAMMRQPRRPAPMQPFNRLARLAQPMI